MPARESKPSARSASPLMQSAEFLSQLSDSLSRFPAIKSQDSQRYKNAESTDLSAAELTRVVWELVQGLPCPVVAMDDAIAEPWLLREGVALLQVVSEVSSTSLRVALFKGLFKSFLSSSGRKTTHGNAVRKTVWSNLVITEEGQEQVSAVFGEFAGHTDALKSIFKAATLSRTELSSCSVELKLGTANSLLRAVVIAKLPAVPSISLLKSVGVIFKSLLPSRITIEPDLVPQLFDRLNQVTWTKANFSALVAAASSLAESVPSSSPYAVSFLAKVGSRHADHALTTLRGAAPSLLAALLNSTDLQATGVFISALSAKQVIVDVVAGAYESATIQKLYCQDPDRKGRFERAAEDSLKKLLPDLSQEISVLRQAAASKDQDVEAERKQFESQIEALQQRLGTEESRVKTLEGKNNELNQALSESLNARIGASANEIEAAIRAQLHKQVKVLRVISRENPEIRKAFLQAIDGLDLIGQEGDRVPFDPLHHELAQPDTGTEVPIVTVVEVGYRWYESVLERALVRS